MVDKSVKENHMAEEFTVSCESIAGNQTIDFRFVGDTFRAEVDGAKLYGEYERDGATRIRLTDANGVRLADVTAHARLHRDATENALEVASALMWSHLAYVAALAKPAFVEEP